MAHQSSRLSSSCSISRLSYDVFLSFRGEDTRFGFTDHLYEALTRKGIHTFRDNEELKMGEAINPELLRAIEESRYAVIILSRNYASSTWCLDELVHIVKCKEEIGLKVIPVFYHVEPSEVRKQAGDFEKAIAKHNDFFMAKCREELTRIVNAVGWDVNKSQTGNFSMDLAILLGKDSEDDGEKGNTWMEVLNKIANLPEWNSEDREVRKKAGNACEAFAKLENDIKKFMERKDQWKKSLSEIANVKGIHLKDSPESQVIQTITREITDILSYAFLSISKKLVGLGTRMEKLESYLCIGYDDIRIIGIWGMGGIGKTTIAREVFKKYRDQFEAYCHIENVRKKATEIDGLVSLQKILCKSLLDSNISIQNVDEGMEVLQRRLQSKKVLIILDDVDDIKQIVALVGKDDEENLLLGRRSRVIITTRDERSLVAYGVHKTYKVDEMIEEEALQLFCQKAFKRSHSPDDYSELSKNVVKYCSGLPLALDVLGSFLQKRSIEEWSATLYRLEREPEEDIIIPLLISFDGLKDPEKDIFLDIACFFNGKHRCRMEKIFESCGFHPGISISVLEQKSLLNIENDEMRMHDLLQKMGQYIVHQESRKEPSERSRLWLHPDVYDVFSENKETKVEAMFLSLPEKEEIHLNDDPYLKMHKLRLLKIHNVNFSGCVENLLSNKLRLLDWQRFPLESMPSRFQPKKLVELKMHHSNIKQLWDGRLHLDNLVKVDLSYSQCLTITPDFSKLEVPNLRRLYFEGCKNLVEVHSSIGVLQCLILLSLKDCENLERLPQSIGLKSLRVLSLSGCLKLAQFPVIERNMEQLVELDLDKTAIRELPLSIERLTGLRRLTVKSCKNLLHLPSVIYTMPYLKSKPLSQSRCSQYIKDRIYGGEPSFLCFDCTRIPDWLRESRRGSSVKTQLTLDDVNNKWVGLVVFIVFENYEFDKNDKIWAEKGTCCHVYTNQEKLDYFLVDMKTHSSAGTNTCCCYRPLEHSAKEFIKKADFIEAALCSHRPDLEVKYCGLHLISEHHIVKFVGDLTQTTNENLELDSNFCGHCKRLLDEAPRLESLNDAMAIECGQLDKFLPPIGEPSDEAEAQLRKHLESSLLILFEEANARKYRYSFTFPLALVSQLFFHLCPGNVAMCYLPRNIYDDKRWVGVQLFASIIWNPSASSSDPPPFLNIDLHVHESAAFHTATYSLQINNYTKSSQSVFMHVPCGLFYKELNKCSGMSAFFRSSNPNVEIVLCGANLVYEQDLEIVMHEIRTWASMKPHDVLGLLCLQAKEYVRKVIQFLPGADNLVCNVGGDICMDSTSSFQSELSGSLQKFLTSTDQEAENVSTLLRKYRYTLTDLQKFEVFEPIILHSKRHFLNTRDLILKVLGGKQMNAVVSKHIHIMAEILNHESESVAWRKTICILLQFFMMDSAWITLTLKGHIISVLKRFDPWLTYNFYFPKKEILKWFRNQSSMSSVSMELPGELYKDNSWKGLVICASLAFPESQYTFLENLASRNSFKVICHLKAGWNCLNPAPIISITKEKFKWLFLHGFIWVTYVPRALLTELTQQSYLEAEIYTDCPELVADKCSIRLLYQKDVKELKMALLQCFTSFLEDRGLIYEFIESIETNGVDNRGQNKNSLLQMPEEIKGFDRDEIYYSWFPTTKTLGWFKSYQNGGPSMTIQLPSTIYSSNSWIGLALFAYFSDLKDSENSHDLFVHLTSENGCLESLQYKTPIYDLELDHYKGFIWLSYIPREWLLDHLSFCNIMEASFAGGSLEVDSCGLRVLYRHEEEEFKHQCIDRASLLDSETIITNSGISITRSDQETSEETTISRFMRRLLG